MAVIRVSKTNNYTTMSNYHFREKEMSLKAKGLMSLMLSLPDEWDYSVAGLVAICKESEDSIKSALAELKRFGYLSVTKLLPNQTESGRIEYVYDVFEKPKQEGEKQGAVFQGVENQGVENQGVENTPLKLNTNNKITKELNNKESNTEYIYRAKRFVKPSVEEIKTYCEERNNSIDAEYFFDYYETRGWMLGKSKMKDWKGAVRTWEKNSFEQKKEGRKPYENADGSINWDLV